MDERVRAARETEVGNSSRSASAARASGAVLRLSVMRVPTGPTYAEVQSMEIGRQAFANACCAFDVCANLDAGRKSLSFFANHLRRQQVSPPRHALQEVPGQVAQDADGVDVHRRVRQQLGQGHCDAQLDVETVPRTEKPQQVLGAVDRAGIEVVARLAAVYAVNGRHDRADARFLRISLYWMRSKR